MERPADWPQRVHADELEKQIVAVRKSIIKGQPCGSEPWVEQMVHNGMWVRPCEHEGGQRRSW
jgi:hypothetical protein